VIIDIQNLTHNVKAQILECSCDERLKIFGLRPGEILIIIGECPFGGTIIVQTRMGQFCVRRNEIKAKLKTL
jgi:Fe2+ transport system protein FeoA